MNRIVLLYQKQTRNTLLTRVPTHQPSRARFFSVEFKRAQLEKLQQKLTEARVDTTKLQDSIRRTDKLTDRLSILEEKPNGVGIAAKAEQLASLQERLSQVRATNQVLEKVIQNPSASPSAPHPPPPPPPYRPTISFVYNDPDATDQPRSDRLFVNLLVFLGGFVTGVVVTNIFGRSSRESQEEKELDAMIARAKIELAQEQKRQDQLIDEIQKKR